MDSAMKQARESIQGAQQSQSPPSSHPHSHPNIFTSPSLIAQRGRGHNANSRLVRHDEYENAKNKRIEYETHTTGVYKEHGKDYRVLCNDLTGNNNRAVKKIKREIRGAGKVGGSNKVEVKVPSISRSESVGSASTPGQRE